MPTIPDFAYISDNRQKSAPVSPYYEFGGKWKVRQKLNLEHKCDSIYTATWMHTSLCCVVLNTSAFFRSSMQEFLFWKGRSQLKTPYHSSFPLGQEIRDSNHSCFRETPCLFVIGIGKRAKSIADVPDCTNLSFHLSGMIAAIAEI